jgi:hypothetical protein
MFPEESFAEVEWEQVEERWRRGQGYKSGKDSEQRSWVEARVTGWARRDEAVELGRQMVGWRCKVHWWGYWAREIRCEDDGEDGDQDEEERFEGAEE